MDNISGNADNWVSDQELNKKTKPVANKANICDETDKESLDNMMKDIITTKDALANKLKEYYKLNTKKEVGDMVVAMDFLETTFKE